MKRKQSDAGMEEPDKNAWFFRYKQCFRCKTWGLDGQDGCTHKVYVGSGNFEEPWICDKCFFSQKGPQEKDKHDDADGGDDETNEPGEGSKRVLRRTDTLPPIPEEMEVDG